MGYTCTFRDSGRPGSFQPFQQELLLRSLQNAAFSIGFDSLFFYHVLYNHFG